MIKKITALMAILALGFIATSTSAVDFSASKGAALIITSSTTKIPGATPLTFNPSAQVNISGGTVVSAFCAMTGHEGVQGKDAGQNYGMASDSSDVFWVKSPASYSAVTGNTNSLAFRTTYNRY